MSPRSYLEEVIGVMPANYGESNQTDETVADPSPAIQHAIAWLQTGN